ncbi:MAG: ATP-binding protein [Spirochaetales bacterium]|nr:ATP-binding protein [Spirochaetales bacterium]
MREYVKRINQKASKLSNEQLLSIINELYSENESLYSLIDSLSNGLLIVDNNFCLLRNNLIVESRIPFSVHLDEIKDSNNPLWEYIEDEEIAGFFKNCMEKEITNSTEEFSTVTSGGSVRFLNISISPLMQEGNLCGKIILVNDITHKKNQDVRLHRMENLANLTNLAAGMAHEIKNPLGAMSIHIQLIQKALVKARENDSLPEKKFLENHLDVVNEEIEHLNKLVMDFLLAVRPVNANLELKIPDTIIKNVIEFIRPEFLNCGIQIETKFEGNSKKIMLDEKLFRDVIINLTQNSLAAIKTRISENQKNYSGLFEIQTFINDNKYIIVLSDNGCGMNENTVSKIFEPYFTTKANGTGLGMTMAYKIVKEFSGEILVDSKENKGSKFTLSFPIPQKDTKLLNDETCKE